MDGCGGNFLLLYGGKQFAVGLGCPVRLADNVTVEVDDHCIPALALANHRSGRGLDGAPTFNQKLPSEKSVKNRYPWSFSKFNPKKPKEWEIDTSGRMIFLTGRLDRGKW
jgi:hypothetical protein